MANDSSAGQDRDLENRAILSSNGNESHTIVQSKNKAKPNTEEKRHIERIKSMSCIVCQAPAPSECHEINQGQWFTSMPLCADCHRGSVNGIHGQRRLWNVYKMDELLALNETIRKLCEQMPLESNKSPF